MIAFEICSRKECTGCFGCVNSCPLNIIKMEENEFGHIYPQIDFNKCIDCGQCRKNCPNNNEVIKYSPNKAFAAWNKDELLREESTSGGITPLLSKWFLDNGGVVFATTVFENNELKFESINVESIYRIKGSKYVQSNVNDIFFQVKEQLGRNKKVLFIGVPCQVSGLISFLGKNYENLFTVDTICHGIPPQKQIKEEIGLHGLDVTKVENIKFRTQGGSHFEVVGNEGTLFSQRMDLNLYCKNFYAGLSQRDSCYQCKYCTKERVSDLTVGDFWGIGELEPFTGDLNKGVNLLFPNTGKGNELISKIEPFIHLEERPMKEAINGNLHLTKSLVMNDKVNKFRKLYISKGYKKASVLINRKDFVIQSIAKNRFIQFMLRKVRRSN